jgi:hypothetical protein
MKNFEKWKDSISYGYRSITETIFSSMKRMFGEYIYLLENIQTWLKK